MHISKSYPQRKVTDQDNHQSSTQYIGHFGQFKTAQYIRRYFWWPSMSHDIESCCKTCSICAMTKDMNSKPAGLLHRQGTTCFLLQKHLEFPTPTSDTFSILWTPTTSQFWRHFGVLLIPSPFQQSPTLPHAPSTPTPCPTPPPKAAPRPPPPPKVTQRPLWTLHPLN